MLMLKPKRYRYPIEIISIAVWSYHRLIDRYRNVLERLLHRGIDVSYEALRQWCIKLGAHFKKVISKFKNKGFATGDDF